MLLHSILTLFTATLLTAASPLLHLDPRGATFADLDPFSAAGYQRVPAKLPALPYAYDALEPSISEKIMKLHHDKHHRAYVTDFNAALQELQLAIHAGNVTEIVRLTDTLKFEGGGHINHSLFWRILSPSSASGGSFPSSGPLHSLVKREYGSLSALQTLMGAEGEGVQGSGWVWLGYNGGTGVLQVETTHNQDLIPAPLVPIVGIDVWEHAYYLDYKNNRTAYLSAIWNVVDWNEGEARLEAAMKGTGW